VAVAGVCAAASRVNSSQSQKQRARVSAPHSVRSTKENSNRQIPRSAFTKMMELLLTGTRFVVSLEGFPSDRSDRQFAQAQVRKACSVARKH
jgi:hypothetical protein